MADIPPPPPGPPTQPQASQPPPASPGYMPPAIGPSSGRRIDIGAQIVGAGWSIGVGAAGILLPVVSGMILGGNIYYFYVLPIFGVVYGIRAMTRGFVIGGVIGVVLNVVAGIVSLTVSGLISPGA